MTDAKPPRRWVVESSGPVSESFRWWTERTVMVILTLLVSAVCLMRFWLRPGLGDWDIMSFYLPWYAHLGERLRSGDIPGWNPYLLSGTPFAGNPQSGWGYAPAMLLFSVLPPVLAFKVLIWFHLTLAALASALLARLLGIGLYGSLIAGAAYALTANLAASSCCTLHVQLAPWLPLSLIGVELADRQGTWLPRLAWLSLSAFAFSQAAAAWVGQGTYNAALILGGYIVVRELTRGVQADVRSWLRHGGHAVITGAWVFGIGGMLAAAGLLPRLDVVRRTYVGSGEYRTYPGVAWQQVVELLFRFGRDVPPYWSPFYAGGAVAMLAVIGLATGLRDRRLWFFGLLMVSVVVLPLRPTPLHALFYALPSYREVHLHDPYRVLAVLPLATALLAGAGADRLTHPIRGMAGAIPLAAAGTVWTVVTLTAVDRPWDLSRMTSASALLCLAGVAWLWWWEAHRPDAQRGRRRPWFGGLFAVLAIAVIADPAASVTGRVSGDSPDNGRLAATIDVATGETDPGGAGEAMLALAGAEPFRYVGYVAPEGDGFQAHELFAEPWVQALLINNRALRLGLHDAQGYDPAQLLTYLDAFTAANGTTRDYHEGLVAATGLGSPVLDLLNVRYVIVSNVDAVRAEQTELDGLPPTYREVWRNTEVRVLENTRALPRAWVVHDAASSDDPLAAIADGTVDPRVTVLLEGPMPALEPPVAGTSDQVDIARYDEDAVELAVDAASIGMLVLGDVYDDGWSVYVDGTRSELFVADGVLRGVVVPAGAHDVAFRYEPTSLRVGLWLSATGYAAMLGIVGVALWQRRRGQDQARTLR